ncbi:EF-hand domain-containing protein [Massilia orientalis]|jgi:hypothetical protein|uniref:Uncharacterized protein n=1 Tax=Massilia orientalis TaxID=3050128 RepID=A0ACC7MD81_9BURK|nr:hypothetical protein [Massilia sp. YIM B02787]
MTRIVHSRDQSGVPLDRSHRPKPAATTLTPARFSDMYRGAVAAAVDQDTDCVISSQEYATQLGVASGAATRLSALDHDNDGKVTAEEFAQSVDDPLAMNPAAVVERLHSQIAAGMSAERPLGHVLGADGKASDPDALLRFLVKRFPGNVDA